MDGVRLSDCLSKEDAGELQRVGAAYVGAPGSSPPGPSGAPRAPRPLQLGYLVGAARAGRRSHPGRPSELLRRLEREAAAVTPGRARSAAANGRGARDG